MAQVCAQNALALESDLLGDALRGDVVRVGRELHALQLEILQRSAGQEPQGTSANALAACGSAIQ